MPKPTPGSPYVVVTGDTLSGIAAAAYGDASQWRRIWAANQSHLRSGKNPSFVAPNGKSGADLIFPGEVLNLPGDPPELAAIESALRALPTLSGKGRNEFTLIINDRFEVPVISGTVKRSFDTIADGFTATTALQPSDVLYNEVFKPFSYRKAEVYLGGVLAMRGILYSTEHRSDAGGLVGTLEGYSPTADLVDSTVRPPYEARKITLKQRITDMLLPFGIPLKFEIDNDTPFEKIKIEETETIFSHLADLAKQRRAFMTSTPLGELLVARAAPSGPVTVLEEGYPPLLSLDVKFDGRARFSNYRARQQKKRKGESHSYVAVARDARVVRPRFVTFDVSDLTAGEVIDTAYWERSKRTAEAVHVTVEVGTWYYPGTDLLWTENTVITLASLTAYCPDGSDFLIRSVDFHLSDKGATATLDLILPQAYTGEEIVEPW